MGLIGGQQGVMLDPQQQSDLAFRNASRDAQLQGQTLRGQQAYEAQLGNQLNNQNLRRNLIQNAQTNMANNVANQLASYNQSRNATAQLLGNASAGIGALLR